jgi:hypothetical protein
VEPRGGRTSTAALTIKGLEATDTSYFADANDRRKSTSDKKTARTSQADGAIVAVDQPR